MLRASATVVENDLVATGSSITATEGLSTGSIRVATFSDPGNDPITEYTATITWGDGSTSTGTITDAGGNYTVLGTHTYGEEGTYTVSVTINHDTSTPQNVTGTANLLDAHRSNGTVISMRPLRTPESRCNTPAVVWDATPPL